MFWDYKKGVSRLELSISSYKIRMLNRRGGEYSCTPSSYANYNN